jgi:hypothetical protein
MNEPGQQLHPRGRPWGPPTSRCESCAWSRLAGPGPRVLRCLAAPSSGSVFSRVEPRWMGCDRWEDELQCQVCGACCGPAYHAVEVSTRDRVRAHHPDVLERSEGRWQVRRTPDNWCSCLNSDGLCTIYGERPRCCRDFERGGVNCLDARRRTGHSAGWPTGSSSKDGPPTGRL